LALLALLLLLLLLRQLLLLLLLLMLLLLLLGRNDERTKVRLVSIRFIGVLEMEIQV
jgi:hypothetical protein